MQHDLRCDDGMLSSDRAEPTPNAWIWYPQWVAGARNLHTQTMADRYAMLEKTQ